jgi:hypothetical protein
MASSNAAEDTAAVYAPAESAVTGGETYVGGTGIGAEHGIALEAAASAIGGLLTPLFGVKAAHPTRRKTVAASAAWDGNEILMDLRSISCIENASISNTLFRLVVLAYDRPYVTSPTRVLGGMRGGVIAGRVRVRRPHHQQPHLPALD